MGKQLRYSSYYERYICKVYGIIYHYIALLSVGHCYLSYKEHYKSMVTGIVVELKKGLCKCCVYREEELMAKGLDPKDGEHGVGEEVAKEKEDDSDSKFKDSLKLKLPVMAEEHGSGKAGARSSKPPAPPTSTDHALPDGSEAPPPVGVPIVTRSSIKGGDGKECVVIQI